jgi:hypothetical protein
MMTRPQTLEFAKYVIVFTTRPSGSTADVLRSYRMRWQIELVFKQLKSLAQLGHLPKHDERSSRAWLYGKLLVTLLAQKLIRIGRDISPSGYKLSVRGAMQSVARIQLRASPDPASYRAGPLHAPNALFVESDCASPCGKVAQATTSIGKMAGLMTIVSRPADRNCRLHKPTSAPIPGSLPRQL